MIMLHFFNFIDSSQGTTIDFWLWFRKSRSRSIENNYSPKKLTCDRAKHYNSLILWWKSIRIYNISQQPSLSKFYMNFLKFSDWIWWNPIQIFQQIQQPSLIKLISNLWNVSIAEYDKHWFEFHQTRLLNCFYFQRQKSYFVKHNCWFF